MSSSGNRNEDDRGQRDLEEQYRLMSQEIELEEVRAKKTMRPPMMAVKRWASMTALMAVMRGATRPPT